MKLGLLGDIHGNNLALSAVLEAMKTSGVQRLLVTGDLVGYYFSPKQVLELLDPWKKDMVRGNHEDLLSIVRSNPLQLKEIEKKYGTGLRIALEELTEPQLDELTTLPHPLELIIEDRRILLCHGAPWDNSFYIYPDADKKILERCVLDSFDIIVTGHTHYPMTYHLNDCLLLNPGSVGQPRNSKPGASWALLDTESLSVEFRHESYDASSLIKEAIDSNPHLPYLAEVLQRI